MGPIEQMKLDVRSKLTDSDKKVLIDIVNTEFSNKQSLYHQIQEQEKEKILVEYRKSVGYNSIMAKYKKAKKIIEDATTELGKVSLYLDGGLATSTTYDHNAGRYVTNYPAVELKYKFEALEKNAPSMNFKSKLVTRLQLSTTKGEAMVIMREVLGNSILPTINPKQLT